MEDKLHAIVIVGGGAGGLELATKLGKQLGRKKKARIILLDSQETHIWKPLYHEIAAGTLDSSVNEVSYRAHAREHHYKFVLGRMVGVERQQKKILLAPITDENGHEIAPQRSIDYDTLVVAVGSKANDFGTPGVNEHCLFLDTLSQARRFHRLLLNTYLWYEHHSGTESKEQLQIAIVGAGATGVELAAELRLASMELPEFGLPRLASHNVGITLLEAAPRLLPALPERLANMAAKQLQTLNIKTKAGTRVTAVASHHVILEDDTTLNADIVIWAAGIKAPECLKALQLDVNRAGQLMVNDTLQTTEDKAIFAFGDCTACPQADSPRPVPPRAQAAHQQAAFLVKNLRRHLAGKPLLSYRYKDYGSLVSFSRFSAIGQLMGGLTGRNFMIEGWLAKLFYVSLYRMHQIALRGYARTMLIWFVDRINKALRPPLKLH